MKSWVLVIAGSLSAGALHAGEWERRSPEGAHAMDLKRAGAQLLLGTTDGLFASADEGSSWTRVPSIPPNQIVTGISVDPRDASHWYIAVSETYLDAGSGSPSTRYREYARETLDGGASWQPPGFFGSWVPVFHPAANRLITDWPETYAYGWQNSDDGGLTWNYHFASSVWSPIGLAVPGYPFAAADFEPETGRTLRFRLGNVDAGSFAAPVAALTLGTPFKSYPKLSPRPVPSQALWVVHNWNRLTYAGSVDFLSGELVQFPPYDKEGYEAFDDPASPGGVLLLTKQGDGYGTERFGVSTLSEDATQWNLRGVVEQSSRGPDALRRRPTWLVGSGGRSWLTDPSVGLHRSDDGGATWQVHNTGLAAAAVNAVLLDPRNPDILLAGRDMQSLQRSVDGGLHWADVGGSLPQDVRTLARSPVDPDHVLATARGGLYRSRDAGMTWKVVPTTVAAVSEAPGWHRIVWCASNDTHLLATVFRDLYRSVDGGVSWSFVRTNAYSASFGLHSARQAPQSVYLTNGTFENNGRVLRTDDCGQSFVPVPTLDGSYDALAVSPYDSRLIAMARRPSGNYSRNWVAVSSDGGTSWTQTEVPVDRIGSEAELGWFHGCMTTALTTAQFQTADAVLLMPHLELPRQINLFTRARAADSHCINGRSVAVVGTDDGVWLHRPHILRLFADGFDTL